MYVTLARFLLILAVGHSDHDPRLPTTIASDRSLESERNPNLAVIAEDAVRSRWMPAEKVGRKWGWTDVNSTSSINPFC